jgi:leucyl aminopeptidase
LVDDAINYAEATALVRDLVNTPAADMMPENLAQSAQELAQRYNGEVKHIIGDELLEQNYPTIHAVGRASIHTPRLIDLTWGDNNHPKVTLVGKGVCFDSGGLDMKPAAGMRNMKKDMGGSAHVLGLAQLIMAYNLPINLRVLIPAVENAVSSNALRPGDVVTTRKGLTVEIHNTDAEGRLVLCDALCEAENDDPELIIDFATLTGAMRVALGTELPGFFSTNDEVAAGITLAGSKISDPVWRMPLYSPYDNLFSSTIADMTNCPTVPFGGAITAALYLQRFVGENTDWVHFDVMAFNTRHLSGRPLGGEAFGMRAVFDYLKSRYK